MESCSTVFSKCTSSRLLSGRPCLVPRSECKLDSAFSLILCLVLRYIRWATSSMAQSLKNSPKFRTVKTKSIKLIPNIMVVTFHFCAFFMSIAPMLPLLCCSESTLYCLPGFMCSCRERLYVLRLLRNVPAFPASPLPCVISASSSRSSASRCLK